MEKQYFNKPIKHIDKFYPHSNEVAVEFEDGTYNFLTRQGNFLSNIDFIKKPEFYDNLAIVTLPDNTQNYLKKDGTLLLQKSYKYVLGFYGEYAVIEDDENLQTYIKKDGRFITNKKFKKCFNFHTYHNYNKVNYFAIVKTLYNTFNLINEKGEYLSDIYFKDIDVLFFDGFYKVRHLDNSFNYLKYDGTLLSRNENFKYAWDFRDGYAMVLTNDNKIKEIDIYGNVTEIQNRR